MVIAKFCVQFIFTLIFEKLFNTMCYTFLSHKYESHMWDLHVRYIFIQEKPI